MKKKSNNSPKTELRRQAEKTLNEKKKKTTAPPATESDSKRLIHELEVHQIELKMQNEELVQSRAQVEAGLRQYTDLYDFAPVGYFTLACDGAIHQVNLAGANLLGVERGALIKRRFGVFVSVEFRSVFNAFIEKVFGSQQKETCEVQLLKYGSTPLWVHIEAIREDGQCEACRIVVSDITERKWNEAEIRMLLETSERSRQSLLSILEDQKRADETLRENLERFQLANRATFNTIWDWNLQTDALQWNENIQLTFGHKPEELEPGIESWANRIHPEDLSRIKTGIHAAIDSGKQSWSDQYRFRRKDGSYAIVVDRGFISRDTSGKPMRMIGAMEDITDRKRAEEALIYERNLLRSLMDNLPDHIYFKDLNSRFLQMSKSQAERFGLSDPVQAEGKTDFDFFTEEHARPAYENEQEIIKTGIPIVNLEEKETWPGGQETWVSTTKVPLRDLNGHIIGTFGISRDMTEQKKLQSQLLQTQKVQSIGTLAGGIAHDFNNILGIILAYTSVLERSEGDKEKISKSTTAITQAVGRGAALVRQILTFARQTGAIVKPLLIPDLIRELVVMLQETFPEVIEFKMTIEKNIPIVNADQTQMHQVLLNLCVNARDAMPKGGIIGIEVKTVTSETLIQQFPEVKSGRYVFISVSDTGIGMDDATKSRIFDPFFTTKEQGKGTGLGLSVVFGVIQDHHGFISVESTVGQGTTFHLYIPVPQEEKKTPEIKNIKIEELQRGSETILFVEDEQLLREVIQSALESNGYKVLLATNGREAVEIYKKHYKDIALVLSDMGLPKLGGIDVYAILKEINPNIKIIFASGFISLETRSELFKEGVKGFIMKPYSVNEVLQMVREVLNENGEKYE